MKKEITVLENIDAVIFDLDGSLVDSMWLWHRIDQEYLGRFGIDVPPDLQPQIEGMSFSETAAYFKERFHIPDSEEKMKADWNRMAWDMYEKEVPLKRGVQEFLDFCRVKTLRLGIATSNSRELVGNIVQVHGLETYFTSIITGCDAGKGKPAPDIYLMAAKELGVKPENCLVFEDIIPGIQAGKAAGMRVCAVEDEYSAYQRDEKRRLADYYIDDYYEITG